MRVTSTLIVWLIAAAIPLSGVELGDSWTYDGTFERVISKATLVIIVDSQNHNRVDGVREAQAPLRMSDANAIAEFNSTFQPKEKQAVDHCMCSGYPTIQWFEGEKLTATVTLHHGLRIRSSVFPGDAELKEDSSRAILEWMLARGYKGYLGEFQEELDKLRANQIPEPTAASGRGSS